MMALRDMPKDGDRRKAGERLRAESRERVMEILTDAQKPVYERLLAESAPRAGAGAAAARPRLGARADGQPKAVDGAAGTHRRHQHRDRSGRR